jgi:hypothetical protein
MLAPGNGEEAGGGSENSARNGVRFGPGEIKRVGEVRGLVAAARREEESGGLIGF